MAVPMVQPTHALMQQELVQHVRPFAHSKCDCYKSCSLFSLVQDYPKAVKCCDDAYELDPTNWKIILRRGKASSLNGDFEEARGACEALLNNEAISDELQAEASELLAATKRREAAAHRKQKDQFTNFFDR